MRVLMNVDDLGPLGGVEQHVFKTAQELSRRGHHVDLLYCHDEGYTTAARAFCASVTQVPSFDAKLRHPLEGGRQLWPGVHAGIRHRPDVVYTNRFTHLAWGIPTAAASRAPLVCHLHFFQEHRATKLRAAPVRRFIAVSHDLVRRWGQAGLDQRRITVAPSGIDLDAFPLGGDTERYQARQTLGLPPDAFIALYCGRIHPEKGVDVLLDAWEGVLLNEPDALLLLVGSSGSAPGADAYHRQLVERHDAGCHWLPARTDIVTPLHAADVVVLPSRSEAAPRIVIEALATGRPVIATRVGGVHEQLDGNFDRFLVESESPDELAKKIVDVVGWQQREPGLAAACRAHVQDRFSLSHTTDLIEEVFDQARGRT